MPVLTLAGFVAHADEWQRVEPIADRIFNECSVPVFHAKEYHDTKGIFSGWSRIRKHSMVQQLFPSLGKELFAVSFSIKVEEFRALKADRTAHQQMSAYGLCFSAITMRLLFQEKISPLIREAGLSFVVESGNNNNAEIQQAFNQAAKYGAIEGRLGSITFVPKISCRAIQLADYWAFYSRRLVSDLDKTHGKFKIPPRLPRNFYTDAIFRQFPYWQHFANNFSEVVDVGKIDEMKTLDEIETSFLQAAQKFD